MQCKFFFCRARALARVIGSSRDGVVELVVPGRPLGLCLPPPSACHSCSMDGPRAGHGRTEARRRRRRPQNCRILGEPQSEGGLWSGSAICGCRWPRNGKPWGSGHWWELARLARSSQFVKSQSFFSSKVNFQVRLLTSISSNYPI